MTKSRLASPEFYARRYERQADALLADLKRSLPEPLPELVSALRHVGEGNGRRALDIGSGGGGNLFFLARSGFDVTGIDTEGINSLGRVAASRGITNVRFAASDVMVDGIRGKYDLMVASRIMQYLGDGKAEEERDAIQLAFIREMMQHTRAGGYDIHIYFTREPGDEGVSSGREHTGVMGRLGAIYREDGWRILSHVNGTTEDFNGSWLDVKVLVAKK